MESTVVGYFYPQLTFHQSALIEVIVLANGLIPADSFQAKPPRWGKRICLPLCHSAVYSKSRHFTANQQVIGNDVTVTKYIALKTVSDRIPSKGCHKEIYSLPSLP